MYHSVSHTCMMLNAEAELRQLKKLQHKPRICLYNDFISVGPNPLPNENSPECSLKTMPQLLFLILEQDVIWSFIFKTKPNFPENQSYRKYMTVTEKFGSLYQQTEWTMGMMTSSTGHNFSVTGPLCGKFTGDRWIPRTKASDAELWCFLWSAPEQTVQ